MTKDKALELGYCKHCAAYNLHVERGWRCGITMVVKRNRCILPADVQERFRQERGLEGETKREVDLPAFGDLAGLPGKYKPFRMRKGKKK